MVHAIILIGIYDLSMNSVIYSIMTNPQMIEFLNVYDYSGRIVQVTMAVDVEAVVDRYDDFRKNRESEITWKH